MAAKLWEGCYGSFRTANDDPASGALAYFYAAGTSTPITVYSDNSLSTPRVFPVTATAAGRFPAIYLPYVSYRVLITDASGVTIQDFDGIANPEPPDSGGGGGVTVSADEIFQTGDPLFLEIVGTRTGWVRDNGRTIGSAASSATERANADCADLYAFYWNNFSDALCPVSGGRGASAASDFAANKPIATLDKRGRSAVGLDDMGNTAANRIQASTTLTTVNGSPLVTAASLSGISIGMFLVASGISSGTTVTGINTGTNVVSLSANASASASGVVARFSHFTDAQSAGAQGGAATHSLNSAENGSHTHTGTTSSDGSHLHTGGTDTASNHQHSYGDTVSNGFANVVVGSGATVLTAPEAEASKNTGAAGTHSHSLSINSSGSHTHSFTTAATGSSLPHSNLQPGILGTWFRKL
jgi:hypothetical protein